MTPKRTDENEWQAIDLLAEGNPTVGWFPTDLAAYEYAVDKGLSVSVWHRPKRRKK